MAEHLDDMIMVPRAVVRDALLSLISEVSEEVWAASWMGGRSEALWDAVQQSQGSYRGWVLSERRREQLRFYGEALHEWPLTPEAWVPLSAMAAPNAD